MRERKVLMISMRMVIVMTTAMHIQVVVEGEMVGGGQISGRI
jgi:ABC-type branched-subunit amino acid transport system ATPase component